MSEPLRSILADVVPNVECPICEGEGWVCEDHPEVRWRDGDGCCGGAGMPCRCTPAGREPLAPATREP